MNVKGFIAFSVFISVLLYIAMVSSCTSYNEQKGKQKDTRDSGMIYVSADESFKPVIDAELQVFESQNPHAKIIMNYKPEQDCLKDLFVDSVRMVIATRGYTPDEENFMVDSMKLAPEKMILALDAIAVIVNPKSPDSLFTMTDIKQILTGKFRKNLMPVFDGVKATSTVRFIIDSVLRGDSLSPKASAARSSEGVIDYVSKHEDAIGFIGVSWIGNKDDTAQVSFLKKVKMAQLESTNIPGSFILPVQANIYLRRYPMIRGITYILKENHIGLGHGFADFMSGEIGQLIFKRAYLVPVQMNFHIRPARVVE